MVNVAHSYAILDYYGKDQRGEGVSVVVTDTGLDINHGEFLITIMMKLVKIILILKMMCVVEIIFMVHKYLQLYLQKRLLCNAWYSL